MAQDTPMSGIGTSSGSEVGNSSTGSMSGTGSDRGRSLGSAPGASTASEICPTCGRSGDQKGLEQFLGMLGISEEMVGNLKSSLHNVDLEEYLGSAREYLTNGTSKATNFAKENPGKVAAGVAAVAIGAGLLLTTLGRDRR